MTDNFRDYQNKFVIPNKGAKFKTMQAIFLRRMMIPAAAYKYSQHAQIPLWKGDIDTTCIYGFTRTIMHVKVTNLTIRLRGVQFMHNIYIYIYITKRFRKYIQYIHIYFTCSRGQ